MNEPAVLTQKSPSSGAMSEAASENSIRVHRLTVAEWLRDLGFQVRFDSYNVVYGTREFAGAKIDVRFTYEENESHTRVYKRLCVRRDGRPSNITLLRKIAQQVEANMPQ